MANPRYSSDDIQHFQAVAGQLKMSAPVAFWLTPVERLREICNGVGGDGSRFTGVLTFIYRHYQVSASIHDVDYATAERPRGVADRAFRGNMLKEWKARYGVFRWLTALRERARIEAAYLAVAMKGGEYYGKRP